MRGVLIKNSIVFVFCFIFSIASAQTQKWNHFWSVYNPSTGGGIYVIPDAGATEEQYFQQALKLGLAMAGAKSCESSFIAFNDPSTGNISGPIIETRSME